VSFGLGSRQKLCEDCRKLKIREGIDYCNKWLKPMEFNHNSCFYYSPKEILKSRLEIDFKINKPYNISKFLKDIKNFKNDVKKRYPVKHLNLPSKKGIKGYHRLKLIILYPNDKIGRNII
jgi:hypothetical protein